jgi:hypothetical protein
MRRHRWMAVVPYEVTDQDALRMVGLKPMRGAELPVGQHAAGDPPAPDDERPFLGTHNMQRDLVAVACWDCEIALTDARLVDMECSGQPAGELAYVGPDGQAIADEAERQSTRAGNVPAGTLRGVGRNEPCPCGSGVKYKWCHGR